MKQFSTIDTHTHIGALPHMIFTGEMAIEALDKAGVDKTIAIRIIRGGGGPFGASPKHNPYNGNDYIAKMQEKYPERIIGFCMIDVYDQNICEIGWKPGKLNLVKINNAIEELKRCIRELKLKGLFLHPDFQCYAPNEIALVAPILDTLVELQREMKKKLPVLIHGVGNNIHYVVPEQIGEIAKSYPELSFIASQLGWASLADSMIEVAKKQENIYLELVLNINILDTKKIVNEIDAQRLTLGTDAPWGSYTLGRKMIEEIAGAEKQDYILGGTIAELLGIS